MALTAVMRQDTGLVRQICSFERAINASLRADPGINDWLYGRAGYLYILRLCRTLEDPTSSTATLVNAAIEKTVDRILVRIMIFAPQYSWHGETELDAVHGTADIICQLVLSQPSAAILSLPMLRTLLNLNATGRFPSITKSASPDPHPQFYHRHLSFALSFAALAPLWPDLQPRIEQVVRAVKEDTWRYGLKGPCLLEGMAGYALVFGGADEEEQARFNHFLAFMSSSEMERRGCLREAGSNNEFGGLYTGEAGRAWVWAQAVAAATATGGRPMTCIGYNDI
ncbi:hypothetical protein F4821DRAFT_249939 [Hypoxylon rubiginosum]|uniref:Uncharacterized protein n=1 Tax=Hypoxylon rubiginosum TaxID=110542 RepID=A0ACC0CLE4_9PEZI|nr:hypothetical protein F4821DRAFT_249939 [Hypoxylon rubiginosum]